MNLILFMLIAYGITQIIVESYILSNFRMWVQSKFTWLYALLSCMMCTGYWVGIILSEIFWSPVETYFGNVYGIVYDGFLTSAVVWLISRGEQFLNRGK